MAPRTRVVVVALMLAITPMLSALASSPNDAGSGQDAPDQPEEALNLSPGAYVGNLTSNSGELDADWYRANASSSDELACTHATFTPKDEPHNLTSVHLRQPALEDGRVNATTTSSGQTLAMVGPKPSGALVGLAHQENPRETQYDLDLDVKTIDELSEAGSADEIPGPCFGGSLLDAETHEWTFEAEDGDFLFVSLGTELARLDELVLEAPNGTDIGSIVSGDDIALGAKTLDVNGTWTLSLEAGDTGLSTTSDYTLGFSLDPPEEEEEERGCSPHCLS